MQGGDPEAQVGAELEQIMPLISALTGLPMRWSGVVEIVETLEFSGNWQGRPPDRLASHFVP